MLLLLVVALVLASRLELALVEPLLGRFGSPSRRILVLLSAFLMLVVVGGGMAPTVASAKPQVGSGGCVCDGGASSDLRTSIARTRPAVDEMAWRRAIRRYRYDPPSTATTALRVVVATDSGTAGEAGTGADSHGGGKNAQHGDGGRRAKTLEQQIQEAKDQLAELNRTQGPKRDKVKLGTKIRNLEQEARDAASGENHSQRPKR